MSENTNNADKLGELIDTVQALDADERIRLFEAVGRPPIPRRREEESREEVPEEPTVPSKEECECFCRVLRCLTDEEVFGEFYERYDIDLEAFRECVEKMCRVCIDFRAYQEGQQVQYPFEYQGFRFDVVDPGDRPGSYGQPDYFQDISGDGIADLPFPERGQRIDVPTASSIEVYVTSGTRKKVVLQAFDKTGTLVDKDSFSGGTGGVTSDVLAVQDRRIAFLIINGGGNEGYITQICYTR